MNKSVYLAHVRQSDSEVQYLSAHLTQTAELARLFASKLALDCAGQLLGLMHDFGKIIKIIKLLRIRFQSK